jgi:DNA-binding MarR family transcriptional regulator
MSHDNDILCQFVEEPQRLLTSTGYLLTRVGSESRRRFGQALEEHDLTLAQFSVLMTLGERDTAPQRELAAAIGIDPRNLVLVLDALEARSLLRRDADASDRRRHAVTLTAAGRALLTEVAHAADRAEEELLSSLTSTERRQLHSLLARLLPGDPPRPQR